MAMKFFNFPIHNTSALITNEQAYTYEQLQAQIDHYSFQSEQKEIVLILCKNNSVTIAAYLATLQQHHVAMLLHSDTNPTLLTQIVANYQPKWIVGDVQFPHYRQEELFAVREVPLSLSIHPDLAVLLSTSGTTGTQKFVRLSYDNLQANAQSIVNYMHLDEHERALMNLPVSYSYGLSIINSHLLAKATILLTDESVLAKSFWEFVAHHRATSLPGVPFTYQMLQRIGFMKKQLPHLKMLTQAGGHLSEKYVRAFAQYAEQQQKRFFVMYGQTEASPRMAYVPPERLSDKVGTIGVAVPGGTMRIDEETSELIYEGPNVMMGYAEQWTDLSKGDELHGVLHTGDVATVDEEGYFTITGRLKRFIKLFGLRINLDEVEKTLETHLQIPVACTGNDDQLLVVMEDQERLAQGREAIAQLYKLHPSAYKMIVVDAIPRLANGKTDYVTLKEAGL